MTKQQPILIKIGSNVLTQDHGAPDLERMNHLVAQIMTLRKSGRQVVLVSSGAVAFGRQSNPLSDKLNPVLKKQIWAATGQIKLIQEYDKLFQHHGQSIAQILVTKDDFRDRKHYLNMKNCMEALLHQEIIPVVNENDTVTITELMFTDNDELAGLTAAMIDASTLLLLTNVDGIYTGNPQDSASRLIPEVATTPEDLSMYISASKSSFGRGGMLTKYSMAKKSADLGIEVIIANGKRDNILEDLQNGSLRCTRFVPKRKKQATKKWLAHGSSYYKGELFINEGARASLSSAVIRSLLPIGVTRLEGDFSKGDILLIRDPDGQAIGLGKAAYSSKSAQEKLGQKNQKPIIHYDYLYLFDHV